MPRVRYHLTQTTPLRSRPYHLTSPAGVSWYHKLSRIHLLYWFYSFTNPTPNRRLLYQRTAALQYIDSWSKLCGVDSRAKIRTRDTISKADHTWKFSCDVRCCSSSYISHDQPHIGVQSRATAKNSRRYINGLHDRHSEIPPFFFYLLTFSGMAITATSAISLDILGHSIAGATASHDRQQRHAWF